MSCDALLPLVWLSRANHAFKSFKITSNYENYALVEFVQYRLTLIGPLDSAPVGYLFLYPVLDLQSHEPIRLGYPDFPAYWSLDPSGAQRLSTEKAENIGFPSIALEMEAWGCSWDANGCCLTPGVQLSEGLEASFAHVHEIESEDELDSEGEDHGMSDEFPRVFLFRFICGFVDTYNARSARRFLGRDYAATESRLQSTSARHDPSDIDSATFMAPPGAGTEPYPTLPTLPRSEFDTLFGSHWGSGDTDINDATPAFAPPSPILSSNASTAVSAGQENTEDTAASGFGAPTARKREAEEQISDLPQKMTRPLLGGCHSTADLGRWAAVPNSPPNLSPITSPNFLGNPSGSTSRKRDTEEQLSEQRENKSQLG
ncbi:hypothetical protein B0H17DRAFT_1213838 [Mycena rosella]|uniref:Uncharacterized protein n=1 Tax=Mycena rosella TaxID=1033263 RepID=A0AAD7CPE1_MYCRO|nr:hypothetical protein B0H17DRAFT_1213838 [Mycena rosella]